MRLPLLYSAPGAGGLSLTAPVVSGKFCSALNRANMSGWCVLSLLLLYGQLPFATLPLSAEATEKATPQNRTHRADVRRATTAVLPRYCISAVEVIIPSLGLAHLPERSNIPPRNADLPHLPIPHLPMLAWFRAGPATPRP